MLLKRLSCCEGHTAECHAIKDTLRDVTKSVNHNTHEYANMSEITQGCGFQCAELSLMACGLNLIRTVISVVP